MNTTKLFQPLTICGVTLKHRIVMAPLTRFRAGLDHVPLAIALEYYCQRAATPGTLIITEATMPSLSHCSGAHAPGIWSPEQIKGWKEIVDAVHSKGCYMIMQLCAPGRAAAEPFSCVAPSAVPMTPQSRTPREMTGPEIQDCISDFVVAAQNAIVAGFDGVEIHGANGYLIDQFTQDTSNKRDDVWGGSIENRSQFGLEITKAVAEAIGNERVGYRISPYSNFQGMRMADPNPQFAHLVENLKKLRLGYLHIIESRVNNIEDVEKTEGIEFLLNVWNNQSPVLVAGGFKPWTAKNAVDVEYSKYNVAVVFGRYFLSTPDLVFRLSRDLQPSIYDRDTFYSPITPKGYIDYPYSEQFLASRD